MCDKEVILRRKQLSTAAVHNLSNIWIRQNRIREHVRLELYKNIVKPVLLHNSQTWGLTVNDEHDNPDSFHRQQIRTALHIKFPHVISSSDHYQRFNEILTLIILKSRWKLFCHILRPHPQTPAQQSMRHYFSLSQNSSFRSRQRITLPITRNKDLVRAILMVYNYFSLCRI